MVTEAIEKTFDWASDIGMILSVKKSLALRVGSGVVGHSYEGPDGDKIEWEDTVKDLGIYMNSDGTLRPTVEATRRN